MALTVINQTTLSDLVVHEIDPSVGYARRVVKLSDTSKDVKMGTLVYRTTASGVVDQGATYAVVGDAADVVTNVKAANEVAVVFGDKFGAKDTFKTGSGSGTQAVAFVRGEVILKDELIMANHGITDRASAAYLAIKAILERQGIILETTLGA